MPVKRLEDLLWTQEPKGVKVRLAVHRTWSYTRASNLCIGEHRWSMPV